MKIRNLVVVGLCMLAGMSVFAKPNEDLINAVMAGDAAAVRDALEKGAKINMWNKGEMPILLAAKADDAAVIKELLRPEWQLASKKQNGISNAFLYAVSTGKKNAVEAFVNSDCEIDTSLAQGNYRDVLTVAAANCHADVVDILVNKYRAKYDRPNSKILGIEAKNNEYYTAALWAAEEELGDIDELLEKGRLEKEESFGPGVVTSLKAEIKTPQDRQYWQGKRQECKRIMKKMQTLNVEKAQRQISQGFKKK